jgi:hypothetical protein
MTLRGQQKALIRPSTARSLGVTPPAFYIFDDNSFGYFVRYRIISEDGNRYSAWSNIYRVEADAVPQVEGEILVSGNVIQAIWEDTESRPQYDVFVSFDDGPYVYHGTTPIHSYSLINDAGAMKIEIAIQIESVQKIYFQPLVICEIMYEEGS